MSPIKKSGFTLIEILVSVSMVVVISIIMFSFLASSFSSSEKASISEEVRQNGNHALSTIERLVIPARAIACPDSQRVGITASDGTAIQISCSGGRITSDSAYLTSSAVSVSNCNFVCTTTSGLPSALDVSFTVSQVGAPARQSEKDTHTFQTKMVVKNQRD